MPIAIETDLDEPPDSDVIAAVAAGDRGDPLRLLYRRYARRIYGLGVQLLNDKALAEELVQETFVRIWRNAKSYAADKGSAATWIFTIARRLAIDLWRKNPQASEPEDSAPPTEDHVESVLTQVAMSEALASLSPSHREIIQLSFESDLRQTDIAEKLNIPIGTVKTRRHHALIALKTALRQRGIDD